MKRTSALAFFAATLISIGAAHSQNMAVEFKVPFDFTVGDHKLPMGTYQVAREGTDQLLIQRREGAPAVLVLTSTPLAPGWSARGELVFNRYGNQYFLHQVFCGHPSMHAELHASRLEEEARIKNSSPGTNTVAVVHLPEQR